MFLMNIATVLAFAVTVASSESTPEDVNPKGCIIPENQKDGKFIDDFLPGENVKNGTALEYTCSSGYKINGSSALICNNGKWNPKMFACLELCPPILDKHSTKVTCATNKQPSDCNAATNGTIATLKCAPFYENQELKRNPIRICRNGRWNEEIISCSAVCGLEPSTSINDSVNHFYPWNVFIYSSHFIKKEYQCIGTLINEKTVLTAAECLTDKLTLDKVYIHGVIVAAGKTFEKYENPDPDPAVQYSVVQHGYQDQEYSTKFKSSVAVLILSTPFKLTNRIYPACIDWSNRYKKEFSQPGMGKVAAPAIKHLNNTTNVLEIDLSPLGIYKCTQSLKNLDASRDDDDDDEDYNDSLVNFIVKERYCVNNSSLCANNLTGVGLIKKNSYNKKYYIIGVAVGPCNSKDETIFSRVFDDINFIEEKTNLYSSTEQIEFQTACGIKSVQATELIVEGNSVAKGDYPWQVAIYKVNDGKSLICGGSLISQRVVITAAHCVTNSEGEKRSKNNYIIAVGKYYRNFDNPEDKKNTQFSRLKDIILPSEYKGWEQNHLADIAILISENSFNLSKGIQPICVDWGLKYEDEFLKTNNTGFVTGWGFTQENQSPSEELKDLEVPYIDIKQCRTDLPSDYKIYLTSDKLCSGFLNKGKGVCKGDSGGGLVFRNKNNDRYYLVGVVSLSPQAPGGGCNSQQYALYTQVSKYIKNFILKRAGIYWN